MSGFIRGKEALIALANGEDVEYSSAEKWCSLKYSNVHVKCILSDGYKFRLKPRTITLNGIEVPVPFEPKRGDEYWYIRSSEGGYSCAIFNSEKCDKNLIQFGAWRTEGEIKQVVKALRSIFKC